MPRLDRLPQVHRNTMLTVRTQVNDTTPFVPLKAPLSWCRVAIATAAGLHRRCDRPFGPGDQTYRIIASETPAPEILQSQTSIGFDRAPIMRDINISFPIDPLREFSARGEIGGLAPNGYSFLDAQRDFRRIEAETAPEGPPASASSRR